MSEAGIHSNKVERIWTLVFPHAMSRARCNSFPIPTKIEEGIPKGENVIPQPCSSMRLVFRKCPLRSFGKGFRWVGENGFRLSSKCWGSRDRSKVDCGLYPIELPYIIVGPMLPSANSIQDWSSRYHCNSDDLYIILHRQLAEGVG